METHTTNSSYETDDVGSSFLKDNSRKKTYAEATKEAFMQDTDDGAGDMDVAGQYETKTDDDT